MIPKSYTTILLTSNIDKFRLADLFMNVCVFFSFLLLLHLLRKNFLCYNLVWTLNSFFLFLLLQVSCRDLFLCFPWFYETSIIH